jgi:hypothetical protein
LNKKRELVASPVYQNPKILKALLKFLKNLIKDTISIYYMFVDNDIDVNSNKLLDDINQPVIIEDRISEQYYPIKDENINLIKWEYG